MAQAESGEGIPAMQSVIAIALPDTTQYTGAGDQTGPLKRNERVSEILGWRSITASASFHQSCDIKETEQLNERSWWDE